MLPFALALTGCDNSTTPPAVQDAATTPADAGSATADAATPADAGVLDARAAIDAATVDAGSALDAGVSDAAPVDAGAPDAGDEPDAGQPDAGPPPMLQDPAQDGPFTTAMQQDTYRVPASNNNLPMNCVYPTSGPGAGPYPAVLIGHGFQLPASQYTGYAQRLATFGYVACTADFRAGFLANHAENAADMVAGVDWLLQVDADSTHPLFGLVDDTKIGMMGHSLGGKVSFLAAAQDARIAAVFGLDPVDSSTLCDPTRCPDASDMLPFSIPVGVLGETLDSTGSLQNCAPAADNFQTFYSAANSPALEVDIIGANHMSFIDDPSSCGLPCRACNPATADHADVLSLARAYTVAFFERYLRQNMAYDAYLTGAQAQQRYVQTGLANIQSK